MVRIVKCIALICILQFYMPFRPKYSELECLDPVARTGALCRVRLKQSASTAARGATAPSPKTVPRLNGPLLGALASYCRCRFLLWYSN